MTVPVVSPNASAAIKNAIERLDDFGFELRVGAVLGEFPSLKREHGGAYKDEVTGKTRQFDYRCRFNRDFNDLLIALECKNVASKVIVVSAIKRTESESVHDLIQSRAGVLTKAGKGGVWYRSSSLKLESSESFYPVEGFVGKSVCVFELDEKKHPPECKLEKDRDKDKDVYERWSQALASAVDLAAMACFPPVERKGNDTLTAVLPAVVFPDEVLWQVNYDHKGEIIDSPVQVEECEFFSGKKIRIGAVEAQRHDFAFSHIHFFTLSGLKSFLGRLTMNRDEWNCLFNIRDTKI